MASLGQLQPYMEANVLQRVRCLLSIRYKHPGPIPNRRSRPGESGTGSGLEEHVESKKSTKSTMEECLCRSNIPWRT
jgi:hypothetical protein